MGRKGKWAVVFILSCLFLVGLPALLMLSWSWKINAMDQWPELIRVGLMVLFPILPLVFWYSRQ
ncbi:hypothetical protein [Sansalvadorimonas verongulae]|uniref:hypothetical protein n=1 Tax=Sansalvadorimonas verongulae TaxID=2172824 RepID=UPI0012BB5FE1|nr:hypothetical protein [Sansalvadorimonas verongulae]MTI14443.1 hypothetical protein [Sansalvadorimonas verongulae]